MTEYHSIPRIGWDHFRVYLGAGGDHFGVGIISKAVQYQPSVSTLKEVLMKKWNLIQNLKDMLIRAKIYKVNTRFHASMDVQPVTPCIFSQVHTYVLTGPFLVKSFNYN